MALNDYLLEILDPTCYVDDRVELPYCELDRLVKMYILETAESDIQEVLDPGSVKQALMGCLLKSGCHFEFVTDIYDVLKDLALELRSQVEEIHRENSEIEKNG